MTEEGSVLVPAAVDVDVRRHPAQRALDAGEERTLAEERGHERSEAGLLHELEQLEQHAWRVRRPHRTPTSKELPVRRLGKVRALAIRHGPRVIPARVRVTRAGGRVVRRERGIDTRGKADGDARARQSPRTSRQPLDARPAAASDAQLADVDLCDDATIPVGE